ncbi:Kinase [Hexamita inflata]|uniref:non-specific serine/threonine protein kinase n=1 Tax=Hexamita inflata TaxID=28002 RepID=A0AA86QHR4_9EUKA|nr:Kinase [Hexamita inflata]
MSNLRSYEEIELIGKGAFGEAYLYRDKKTLKKYVIKKIKIHSMETKDREAAVMEANVLNKFSHPNIIGYRESFTDCGNLYIVMDYADSGDLTQIINERAKKKDPFTETEVMYYFVQILLALKHVHDRQILHRDIKAQNIFLNKINTADGAQRLQIKLGDFGIAKVLSQPEQMALTQVGTPYYLSPEIVRDQGYNNKSDIWSLGCVLYELCTFNRVFTGQSLYVVFTKIIMEKHTPIDSSQYSSDLSDIVNLMLTKDPEKRPSVNQLLSLPSIRKWVPRLLSKKTQEQEFPEGLDINLYGQETQIGLLKHLINLKKFDQKFGDQVLFQNTKEALVKIKDDQKDQVLVKRETSVDLVHELVKKLQEDQYELNDEVGMKLESFMQVIKIVLSGDK